MKKIGEELMTHYVLPLEMVGILLTAALIGAVVIAMRDDAPASTLGAPPPCRNPGSGEGDYPPMNTSLTHYLVFSALLFSIGFAGAIARRNAIWCARWHRVDAQRGQLEFHRLLAFWRASRGVTGVMFVIFSIAIAAAEAAVGLALVIAIYRQCKTVARGPS